MSHTNVPQRILVPVDFSECSHAALVYAIELAARLDAEVDVLHVWQAPDELLAVEGMVPPRASHARDEALRSIEELLAGLDLQGVNVRGRIAGGDPVETILHTAAAYNLLVMGRHGRGRLAHMIMGSVTEKVMRRSPCPVVGIHAPVEPPMLPGPSHSDALEAGAP